MNRNELIELICAAKTHAREHCHGSECADCYLDDNTDGCASCETLLMADYLIPHIDGEQKTLEKENCLLRGERDVLTSLHSRAVAKVNAINFEKLKVETRLRLLQEMVGLILTEFRGGTEDSNVED